jgi:hypothetical protein
MGEKTPEERLARLEATVCALSKRLDDKVDSIEKAIVLQAAEYARRLDELNHAHKREQENSANSVRIDVFELYKQNLDEWRTTVNATINSFQGKLLGWGAAIAVMVTVITIVLQAFRVFGK